MTMMMMMMDMLMVVMGSDFEDGEDDCNSLDLKCPQRSMW